MKRSVFLSLSLLSLLLAGCGGDPSAPLDATVSGPEDGTFTKETPPPGQGIASSLVTPLEFRVLNKAGAAVPGVEIEIFAGGGGVLTDLSGNNLLNPNDPTYFKTKTDDRGLARASYFTLLPNCKTEDQTMTGSVLATVGVSSKLWTATYTIKKC